MKNMLFKIFIIGLLINCKYSIAQNFSGGLHTGVIYASFSSSQKSDFFLLNGANLNFNKNLFTTGFNINYSNMQEGANATLTDISFGAGICSPNDNIFSVDFLFGVNVTSFNNRKDNVFPEPISNIGPCIKAGFNFKLGKASNFIIKTFGEINRVNYLFDSKHSATEFPIKLTIGVNYLILHYKSE